MVSNGQSAPTLDLSGIDLSAIGSSVVDLSIVVVSYNTRALLAECLASLDADLGGLRHEVIVVDNASADGSPEMVAADFPAVRLIANQDNRGFAAANNQAFQVSRGRHVLLLNSDARLLPEAAQRMVRFLDEHPEAGIVAARLLNPDGSFQSSFMDFPSLRGELLLMAGLARFVYSRWFPSYPPEQSRQARVVDWVSGACLMARRAAVEAVGGLDESYFMYTEETDWCYRMRRAGWSVWYLPEASVVHHVAGSAAKAPERRRSQVYRSKRLFLRKHRGPLVAGTFGLALRLASAAKLLGWAARACLAGPATRERARGNVRSYRFLLAHL